jgi:hypothetical protein
VFAGVLYCSLLPLTNERAGALQHYRSLKRAKEEQMPVSVPGEGDENKAVFREQGKVALGSHCCRVGRDVDMILICSNTVLVRKQTEKENTVSHAQVTIPAFR